jgi:asparagine N-glycosylation enzyme membrane subunit Stt3
MDGSFTDNVFSLKNNEFYTFIEELVGQQIVDVLKFQSITSTQSLIRNPNIFEIFNMKCTEPNFLSIREKSCFQLDNAQFVVKLD